MPQNQVRAAAQVELFGLGATYGSVNDISHSFTLSGFKPSEYTPAVGQWFVDAFATVVPEHPVLQYNLAYCLARKGRRSDALACFQKALELAEAQKDVATAEVIRAEVKALGSSPPGP